MNASLSAALALLLTLPSLASASPDLESQFNVWGPAIDLKQVALADWSAAGSGCPGGGGFRVRMNADKSITFTPPELVAVAAPELPITDSRRSCQIALSVQLPAGWQYAVSRVSGSGTLQIEDGVTALHKIALYFGGNLQQAEIERSFEGPQDRDYLFQDSLQPVERVWSPCGGGRALNVNTQVRVNNRANQDQFGAIAVDGPTTLKLAFRRCF